MPQRRHAILTLLVILALILFGPRRLPEIGRTLGRAMRELRRASNELRRAVDTEITLESVREPAKPGDKEE